MKIAGAINPNPAHTIAPRYGHWITGGRRDNGLKCA